VSEAALYRHYPSMQALAQELFTHHFAGYAARLGEATSVGTTEERLRGAVRTTLASYRAEPAAFTFALLRTPNCCPTCPPAQSIRSRSSNRCRVPANASGSCGTGQPNLLAAIFLGCVLRPIIVASLSAPGALDLIGDTRHDRVIEDAAIAALRFPSGRT
jgi:AcrR family transcriptional regulator